MDLIPFVADRVYTNKELRNKVGLSDSEMREIKTVIQEAKLKKEMIENMEYGVPIINSKNKFWFS
jgi:DNA-binding Xre family transcriptional regulator